VNGEARPAGPVHTPVSDAEGRHPLAGAALVVVAAALWATFGPLARLLYAQGFTPLELASIRTWIALAGATAFALITQVSLRIPIRAVPFFIIYGVISFGAFEAVLLLCLERVSVPVAISLLYTSPVFVLGLARVLLGERVPASRRVAVPISLVGVVLVTGAAGALFMGQATIPFAGLAFGLTSGFLYALFTVLGRIAIGHAPPVTSLFWCFLFAAIALALIVEPVRPVLRQPAALPQLLALGLVTTLLPYMLFLRALRLMSAGAASLLACTEPLFAAAFAAVLLGERVSLLQGAGMMCIVGAALIVARPVARPRPVRLDTS
jgi:drug/metabolite transporter (DMT)-like permease